ncbi:hypothetical protein WAI453_009021 [Rhynchosporium graminicola]
MPQIIAGRQNAFNEIKAVSTHTNVIPHTFKYKLGTVVDSDVVTPNHVNFYLQAHASPKGTVRSAHCNVLKDTCGDIYSIAHIPVEVPPGHRYSTDKGSSCITGSLR